MKFQASCHNIFSLDALHVEAFGEGVELFQKSIRHDLGQPRYGEVGPCAATVGLDAFSMHSTTNKVCPRL